MGREMKATGVAIEGLGIVPLEELLTPTEAASLTGLTKALIDKNIYFTPRLDSVLVGSSRLVLKSQALTLKAEIEAEKRQAQKEPAQAAA